MRRISQLFRNVWGIFITIVVVALLLFGVISWNNWVLSKEDVLNEQRTNIELLNNSVRAFIDAQESILQVLGSNLIKRYPQLDAPVHDEILDSAMETYPVYLGLGLFSYEGRPLVMSSNFDLNRFPNLMALESTRSLFQVARDSRKIQTGAAYQIEAATLKSVAMPIRKAIYLSETSTKPAAVMTAGILLDDTHIFDGYNFEHQHHIEIIRGDGSPVFSTDTDKVVYTKRVSSNYLKALELYTTSDQRFSLFDLNLQGSENEFQVVTRYDPFLDFWFVSRMANPQVVDRFLSRFMLSAVIFVLCIAVFYVLTRSVANREKNRQNELLKMAYFDPLTELPNRIYFTDYLRESIANSHHQQNYHALLLLDLDDFKVVNDTHGHQFGDYLLKEVASRIQQCLPESALTTRFGGDEFVILLSKLNKSLVDASVQVDTLSNALLKTLSKPYFLKAYRYTGSASIGIVLFNDATKEDSDLLKQADIAMYGAKKLGKNTYCVFSPEMQSAVTKQYQIENDLRAALPDHQFELYYQPQTDKLGRVFGAEALIRWQHPKNGLVTPFHFIDTAERTGLIVPIGEWVLGAACQQLSLWQKKKETEHLSLSVNVSYRQFSEPDFVDLLTKVLDKHEVKREKIKIELTETMFIDDIEQTIARMNRIRALGIEFSLDDFGTGYSSLKYLKRLPLSQIKIDKSFVDELVEDENAQSIVNTIITMANALKLNTIAEGVETRAQQVFLERQGCLHYQGYFYSPPLDIEGFERYLLRSVFDSN